MTFYTDTHPRARTEHTCGLCTRTIRVGETYRRGVGMDGTAWTYKECAHCESVVLYVIVENSLDEYGSDTIGEWGPDSLAHLRIKANWRRKWQRHNGSLVPVPQIVRRTDIYGFSHVSELVAP